MYIVLSARELTHPFLAFWHSCRIRIYTNLGRCDMHFAWLMSLCSLTRGLHERNRIKSYYQVKHPGGRQW